MNSPLVLKNFEFAVDELLAKAVINTEKAICWARMGWGAALMIFSLSAWDFYGGMSVLMSILPISFFILVSGYFLRILRTGRLPKWLTAASVTIDCLACFFGLYPVVLWPFKDYPGMINMVDMSALMIPLFAAGFRLSVRVAVWGTVLSIMNYSVLMATDFALNAHPHNTEWQGAMLFLVYMLGCAALTVILARHTRYLVRKSALEAIRNTMANQALSSVMQGHHDMKSVLTSATIGGELLSQQLTERFSDESAPEVVLAQKLGRDLARLSGSVSAIKNEAFGNLMRLRKQETVSFSTALNKVLSRLTHDFPAVKFDTAAVVPFQLVIAGGTLVLERILFNLLLNACEGDGQKGATTVAISTDSMAQSRVVIVRIFDNGPGFSDSEIGAMQGDTWLSRKKEGSGLGLFTVRHLLGNYRSSLKLSNATTGGATVQFELEVSADD